MYAAHVLPFSNKPDSGIRHVPDADRDSIFRYCHSDPRRQSGTDIYYEPAIRRFNSACPNPDRVYPTGH